MQNIKIKELFINEEELIKEKINNIPVINCTESYFSYIHSSSSNELEQEYIRALCNRERDFFNKVTMKELDELDEDKLKEIILDNRWHGFWGFDERDSEEQKEWIEERFSDADLHELIKEEMLSTFNTLLEEKKATKKESEKKALEYKLSSIQDKLDKHDKTKEELEQEIAMLKQKISEFEK